MMFDSENNEEFSLFNIIENLNFDIKQNVIRNAPPPPLKYILLLNIAISFWKEKLIYADFSFIKHTYSWDIDQKVWITLNIYGQELATTVVKLEIPSDCQDDLKHIMRLLKNKIEEHITFYCNLFQNKIVNKLKVILGNICWTQQGTINFFKSATQIIDHSDLSIKDKYDIACYLCFKDKIQELLKDLPESIIKGYGEDATSFPFSSFWTSYIRDKEFPTMSEEDTTIDYLIDISVDKGNALSLQYIWEMFANEDEKEQLTEYAKIDEDNNPHISLYFATQMNQQQFEDASSEIYCGLLSILHSISKWYEGFPTTNDILYLIKTDDVFYDLHVISFCWLSNLIEVEEFVNIWKDFYFYFKDIIEGNIVEIYKNIGIKYYYTSERSGVITKILLSLADSQNKTEIVNDLDTMIYCFDLIKGHGLEDFYIFLNILEPDDIFLFKKKLFEGWGTSFSQIFIPDEKYEELDKVLIEFCDEKNFKEFKMKFGLSHIYSLNIELYIDDETDIISLHIKYFRWWLNGNEKVIAFYRRNMFDINSDLFSELRDFYFTKIKKLKFEKKWKLVEKFWQWFYYSMIQEITSSKEKLERIKKIIILTSDEKYCHDELKRFVTFCFNQDEAEKLKLELKNKYDITTLVLELLQCDKVSEANDLLDWLYSSDINGIDDFKTTFIKVNGYFFMFELISEHIKFIDSRCVYSIIKWWNPSAESAIMFKDNFIEYVHPRIKIQLEIHELGDNHFEKEEVWALLNERVDQIIKLFMSHADEKALCNEIDETVEVN